MHLFNKENIWSNPCSFLHTSSHPDNYKNNSVNRIISKEKEREDPRRDSSKTSFQLESKSVSSVSTCNPATYKLILYTELILQEIQENYNNYQVHSAQAYSSNYSPCIQAFYTAETRFQVPSSNSRPYSTSRLPVILPGRNSILHGSQPPRAPYSDSQAQST